MCRDDSSFAEGSKEQLKVWLLEQALSWALWVGGVGDDNIESVLVVVQELEAVSYMDLDFWVLVAD